MFINYHGNTYTGELHPTQIFTAMLPPPPPLPPNSRLMVELLTDGGGVGNESVGVGIGPNMSYVSIHEGGIKVTSFDANTFSFLKMACVGVIFANVRRHYLKTGPDPIAMVIRVELFIHKPRTVATCNVHD